MPDAVIVAAARTPIATAFKGSLVDTDAMTLATHAVKETVARAGLDPELIDDVVLGESLYGGGALARYAAIEAGILHAPGMAHNRHCASGLAAVSTAAATIRAGMDEAVIAGGVQSTSTSPQVKWRLPGTMDFDEMWISPSHKDSPEAPNRDMSITVGWNAARLTGITRDELDAWALRSHQRAVAGIDNGAFVDEIAPIEVSKGGETFTFAVDEHPRRETSMEKLAGLKPLHPEIEGFNITPGNSSGVNDAAGAVMVVSSELAERLGLEPLAIVRSWASAGVDPVETGLAPIQAIPKAAKRAGISLDDVDLFEINEAFASVPIAAVKAFGLDEEKVNPLGSGCSLGHPVAMTGVRMVMTIMNELRRRGGGIGLTSMCAGGGMGSAVVIEVLKP